METAATLLAAIVGALALVRYYTQRSNAILLVGAGFLGTAFLDGYHTVVTSMFFRPYMPSDLPSLISWSWVASRQFLSLFLFFSWLAWLHENRHGEAGKINPTTVYLFAGTLTLASFLFSRSHRGRSPIIRNSSFTAPKNSAPHFSFCWR